MGRPGPLYLTTNIAAAAFAPLLLLSNIPRASASSIWDVNIDESPAPPPSQGPPFSAHASRNRALIPYQVVGIVGAYVGAALLIGSLLSTVGRSRRRAAQKLVGQPTEMVKPTSNTYAFEQSPVSPGVGPGGANKHWYSSRRVREMKSTNGSTRSQGGLGDGPRDGMADEGISPSVASVASFDTTVLEADRRKRQMEMERLYAAVLGGDDEEAHEQPEEDDIGAAYTTTTNVDMPPEYSRRQPPRLATPATNWQNLPPPQQHDMTPKSPARAIYPPDKDLPLGPYSATSPVQASYPHQQSMPTFQQQCPPQTQPQHTRTISSSSSSQPQLQQQQLPPRTSSTTPTTKKIRKSLRNIKISSPLPYDENDNSDNDRTPLSPRWYANPGPPPEPPTPGTSRSAAFPGDVYARGGPVMGNVPPAAPQRTSGHVYQNAAQQITDLASRRADPTKPSSTAAPQQQAAPRSNTLPLRELNRQYALQQQHAALAPPSARTPTAARTAFPLSPMHFHPLSPTNTHHLHYATSAGPTKTTFLEARRDQFGRGPLTGVPTPYSPYMPFTPLTPVAAHLTSKAERRQREREERKLGRAPIVEEEMVKGEGELWGEGY